MTIADLKGYTFRQQLKDHDEWFESANILKQGISGTRIDNPGNLNSDTLNLITKMVATAYQNVRQELQTPTQKFAELVEKLKKEKGYGKVGISFFENQANLYSNLFRDKENYIIKDLKDLHGAEREFAEYFLQIVNENRFRNKTKEQLAQMRDEGAIEYYQIPLKSGDLGSRLANKGGMFNALKFALKRFNLKELPSIKEIGSNIKQKISDFFESDEYQEVLSSDEELFQMSNNFDQGESNREETLQKLKNGKGVETNLETLGLSHIFAYSVKDNIDEIFPVIKAAKIHLITQGSLRNIEGGFKNDIKYIEDYIKSNIKNESILSEKEKLIAKVTTPLKRISSFATLAFSPVQFFYQMLQGLWNDISLIIRKPDGTEAFTFKHFLTAIKIVYADMFRNEPTLCSRLNELYGLNDMDMNQLVDRLKSDNGGFLHLNNFFMKFSSRPDYYNRLTIFICQLLADGSLKAHSLDSKGQLVYDWTKDDRFSLYAKYGNNPTGLSGQQLELYNKQKSLYISTAKQLVKENTYTGVGRNRQLFIYNPDKVNPLPKAYTTLESESMKELADNIYGYYSHEKKSMIHAGLLGSMWMQFRTYWSGKKNQYIGSGGIKLRGRWKTVDGLWYNEKGEIVKEDTGVPVTVWEGDWQEGIALTLSDMTVNIKELGGLKNSFLSKINSEDPKLKLIYRNNFWQLGIDTCMWLIGGVFISGLLSRWLKDFLKDYENINMTFVDACAVAGAKIVVQSVGTSFIDFRWFESIGEPGVSWTPFAFEFVDKTTKRFGRTIVGNEDWWDFAVNSFSAGKQFKPILDTIKPDIFKTESEGGTFVPRRQRKENA